MSYFISWFVGLILAILFFASANGNSQHIDLYEEEVK